VKLFVTAKAFQSFDPEKLDPDPALFRFQLKAWIRIDQHLINMDSRHHLQVELIVLLQSVIFNT
jgi:hypothetical protein